MDKIRFCQISDLHIPQKGDYPFSVDVRQNFKIALKKIINLAPDFLAVTGDICRSESELNIYKWLKKELEKSKQKYFIISGNHDLSKDLAEVFKLKKFLKNNELYFQKDFKNLNLIFLDSSVGTMSDTQLKWLKKQIEYSFSKNLKPLIFMHHPPIKTGVLFMDKTAPFRSSKEFEDILKQFDYKFDIFCGHYHSDRIITTEKMIIHQAPSLFFQIEGDIPEFNKKTEFVGFKIYEIDEQKLIDRTEIFKSNNIN